MKRLVLSAIALSMLAIPSVGAQAAPFNAGRNASTPNVQLVAKKDVVRKRVVVKKNGNVSRKVVRKSSFRQGQRYSSWKSHQAIRDYSRYGLRRPARGQEWIRVGNDYLLVSIATGVIAGLFAAN